MNKNSSSEFFYQLFALLAALIVVHTLYVALIRPTAAATIEAQLALEAAGETIVAERTFYVVVKDYEQEACFILMLWASAIMGYKARRGHYAKRIKSRHL